MVCLAPLSKGRIPCILNSGVAAFSEFDNILDERAFDRIGQPRSCRKVKIFQGFPYFRRGDREAEGAALEMPCTVTGTAGSNPALSAYYVRTYDDRQG